MNALLKVGAAVMVTMLSACGERSAVVRVCTAAAGQGYGSAAAARCRCVDRIARQQLGPERYRILDEAARAAERGSTQSSMSGIAGSASVLGNAFVRADDTERAIAAGDAALIAAKSATYCD